MFQGITQQVPQEKRVLSEIIEYALDPNTPQLKIAEALNISHDDKNILMTLLEKRDLYSVKRLFTIANIIFTHQEILMKKDQSGKDVFSYFIDYATYDLIDEFIRMLSEHTSPDEKKSILSSVDNQGRSHLMMMCENKKFENLEGTFKHFIDLIATSCGLDFLHEMLTKQDNDGNNILMASLKSQNDKIALKILDLISKTIMDSEARVKIEHKLLTQRDSHGKNVLILLSEVRCEKQVRDEIIRLVKEIPSNWLCLIQEDSDGHNMILLAIINHNQEMIDNALSVLSEMNEDGRKLVFSDLCKKFDSNGDNFISLCFKSSRGDLYVKLIEDMEKIIGEQLIVESFSKTFANHQDILHHALIDNNMEAILSLIKYLKLVNNVTENDKRYISELVVRKDNTNSSLLSYAVAKSNYQVCEMILHSAKEFCDSITIKMLINAKDKDGHGPYVIAKLNSDEKLAELLSSFSQEMGIEELISEQMREYEIMNKLQSSHIRPLVTQVFT